MRRPAPRAINRVNQAIGNLSDHLVAEMQLRRGRLVLRFIERQGHYPRGFSLEMEQLVGFRDHGTVGQPLTAGVVWSPVAGFGRHLCARTLLEPSALVELRLDFEDAGGLVTRFNAVARSIRMVRTYTDGRAANDIVGSGTDWNSPDAVRGGGEATSEPGLTMGWGCAGASPRAGARLTRPGPEVGCLAGKQSRPALAASPDSPEVP
ncbi:MAG: hypothetical protein H7A45_17735 [Verrucomicrobiales bacterium]|nr:hypothetical protein [Verrucomicrobiales bacterium]MCP5525398.1 hypothetical protein [Verrucomicrobiales bacterium]